MCEPHKNLFRDANQHVLTLLRTPFVSIVAAQFSLLMSLQEIINVLALASKWLLRDAIDASGMLHSVPFPHLALFHRLCRLGVYFCNVHQLPQCIFSYLLFTTISVFDAGSRDTIGADLLVPLFTMVLINAQLPNVHMILQVTIQHILCC